MAIDLNRAVRAILRIETDESGLTQEERSEWDERVLDYQEWEEQYNGEAISAYDEKSVGPSGKRQKKWPLQINLEGISCRLHQQALMGEVKDPARVPAPVVSRPEDPESDESIAQAKVADVALRRVEYENGLTAVDVECMLLTQVYGGIAMRIYDSATRPSGIAVTYLKPENVWFRWEGTDHLNPTDAWVRFTVTPETAARYGVEVDQDSEYIEHWTVDMRRITIAGHTAKHPTTKELMEGDNPYSVIPIVYIPHFRDGDFWGVSLVPGAKGMSEELNQRMADWGDAGFLGVHGPIVGRNISGGFPSPQWMQWGNIKLPWLNLGSSRLGASSSAGQPELERVGMTLDASLFANFVDRVEEFIRYQLMTAAPAYGQLEGTQRSGQTVYSLAWLMWSHVNVERIYWTLGLLRRADIILTLAAKYGKLGISQEHIDLLKSVNWAPQVPLDRAALTNEMTTRVGDGTVSPETAMEKYGDIDNVPAEAEKIKDWKKYLADIQTPPGESDRLGGSRQVKKETE